MTTRTRVLSIKAASATAKRWRLLQTSKSERERTRRILLDGLDPVLRELPPGLVCHSLGLVAPKADLDVLEQLPQESLVALVQQLPSMCRARAAGLPMDLAPDFEVVGVPANVAQRVLGLRTPPQTTRPVQLGRRGPRLALYDALLEATLPATHFGVSQRLRRLVACPAVQDPGNMGAILRLASSLCGWDGLAALDTAVDLTNPKVVRASRGAVLHAPWLQTDITSLAGIVAAHRLSIVVADSVPSVGPPLFAHPRLSFSAIDTPFKPPLPRSFDQLVSRPLMLVLGAEGRGTSGKVSELLEALGSDHCLRFPVLSVRIPLKDHVDSINVSTAASILMHELK